MEVYMRNSLFALAAVSATFLFTQFCRADEAAKGKVDDASVPRIGLYDINRVATELGWMNDMDAKMKSLAAKFKIEFEHSQAMYQEQINKQKTDWAPKDSDKLTPDQIAVLNNMKSAADQVLAQLNKDANQKLADYKKAWVDEYRKALHPMLRQVADDRKLWVIFEKNDSVAYVVPSADITDAIVDVARADPPQVTPVPIPDLPSTPRMEVKLPTTRP
jgi:Skp family chaperone for outer membrane proteins